MSVAEQADVELANRNGRLHPSQRGKVLDSNFWVAAFLVAAGIVGLIAIVVTMISNAKEQRDFRSAFPGASGSAAGGTVLPSLALMIPVVALVAWFAFVCLRRLSEVRGGRLLAITGWTHDYGRKHPEKLWPIELWSAFKRGIDWHYLNAGGRTYRLGPSERELLARIQPERNNIVLITPRSKILINVLPGS